MDVSFPLVTYKIVQSEVYLELHQPLTKVAILYLGKREKLYYVFYYIFHTSH